MNKISVNKASGIVRKLKESDIESLVSLVAAYPKQLLPRTVSDFQDLKETSWVVEDEGEIVGCATLEIYSPKICEIRTVIVKEGYRQKGYGEKLVGCAVTEARIRNIRQILVVTSNPEYFEKLNFGPCLNEKYALFWNGE